MSVLIGGREYNTVKIGELEWMSENLAFESGVFFGYSFSDIQINLFFLIFLRLTFRD